MLYSNRFLHATNLLFLKVTNWDCFCFKFQFNYYYYGVRDHKILGALYIKSIELPGQETEIKSQVNICFNFLSLYLFLGNYLFYFAL